MDWDDKDDKSQINKDKDYVSRDNQYEIPAMIKKYQESYSKLTSEEIEKVINDCMEKTKAPYPREEVEKCINSNLKIKNLIK